MTLTEQLETRGEIRGELRGEIRGELRGKAAMLLQVMEERFGPLSPEVVIRVNSTTDSTELDRWGHRLFSATNATEVIDS